MSTFFFAFDLDLEEGNLIKNLCFDAAEPCYSSIVDKVTELESEKNKENEDEVFRLVEQILYTAFSFGYIFGTLFEPPNWIKKDVIRIKNELVRRKAIPYLPREKKAA
ncbi:MAG: hypothetical protein ABSH06_00240 [Thermodesulfobacteriota bacterium]